MRKLAPALLTFSLVAIAAALAVAAPGEANVAPCDRSMAGHGSADWRRDSDVAGLVGVERNPLKAMVRANHGFIGKMPMLIEGRAPATVTVSVPPALRGRVFLLYGDVLDRDGEPSTSFHNTRGYDETEFQLCPNKPRTIWPGAIRIKGRPSVRLLVAVEGRPAPIPLRLGRPQAATR